MANYSTEDIKRLRQATSAGMLECKKALDDTDGNYEQAFELIRGKRLGGDYADLENHALAAEGIRASLEKKNAIKRAYQENLRENEKSAKVTNLQAEVESLRREVDAIKKAHNALIAALEKASKPEARRNSLSYTTYYLGEF